MTVLTAPISPELKAHAEAAFHGPLDYLQASNRRKDIWLLLLGLTIAGLILLDVHLALKERPSYVVAIAPDGQEYVLSTPKKKLDLHDKSIFDQVKQDLITFSESYFEHSSVTAQKDYERVRWFLPDQMVRLYDSAALGEKGWLAGLMNHTIPESHVFINSIVIRDADIAKEPYQATVYLQRTAMTGEVTHWIAPVTFVVRPELMAKLSRAPLYNALGVLIVKPIDEVQDFRK